MRKRFKVNYFKVPVLKKMKDVLLEEKKPIERDEKPIGSVYISKKGFKK